MKLRGFTGSRVQHPKVPPLPEILLALGFLSLSASTGERE